MSGPQAWRALGAAWRGARAARGLALALGGAALLAVPGGLAAAPATGGTTDATPSAAVAAPAATPAPAPAPSRPSALEGVRATATVTPDPSNVGDVLTLAVAVEHPPGFSVNLPLGLELAPLHVVDVRELGTEPADGGLRSRFAVDVQHFAVGEARVRELALTVVTPTGEVHALPVGPTPFTVDALTVNEADPQRRGEDPLVSPTYPDERAEVAIIAALLTLAGALLAWLVARRVFARARMTPPPPPVPAHERALTELARLEAAQLVAQGDVQGHYLGLTEIAKRYLQERFGVAAVESTTDEIRAELLRAAGAIAPLRPDEVVGFLDRCDLVKFARLQPPEGEAQAAVDTVRGLVQRSMPRVEPAAAASPSAGAGQGGGEPPGPPAKEVA